MYGKIFDSIFDSTLAAEGGWMPTYIFMSMVVLADKDGVVDVAPKALYRRLGFSDFDSKIEYSEFQAAIEYLQEEDGSSRSPEQAGRRIIPLSKLEDVDGNRGFMIVNYVHYRDKGGSLEKRRENDAARKRRQRGRENNKLDENSPKCHVTVTDQSRPVTTYIDTDTDKTTYIYPDGELGSLGEDFQPSPQTIDYAAIHSFPDATDEETIQAFVLHYTRVNKRLLTDWQAQYLTWLQKKKVYDANRRPTNAGGGSHKTKFERYMEEVDAS